jgi:hypothetical protein
MALDQSALLDLLESLKDTEELLVQRPWTSR